MVSQARYNRLPTDLQGASHRFETVASSFFAPEATMLRAKFSDVARYMGNGDGMWYSGRLPHSWVIRIATVSNVSHGGILERLGPNDEDVYILETLEGAGVRRVRFLDEVKAHPGQYYWAGINYDAWPNFNGDEAVAFVNKLIKKGTDYGKIAILYEALFHVPLLRELAYWRWHNRLDQAFKDVAPYCSMLQVLACIKGGENPVPGRAPQLCAPADTYQSKLWLPEKLALHA